MPPEIPSSTTHPIGFRVVSLLPFLLLAFVAVACFRAWYPLRRFRGPWLGQFTYLFMAKTQRSGVMNITYTEVNRKYGSIARIGPKDLLTSDPDLIRQMSAVRSTFKRSDWYQNLRVSPQIENIFSERDTAIHDARRHKMAGAFSGRENPTLEADIDEQISSFVSLIRQRYLSDGSLLRPMDMARKAQYFTLDVITKLSYGFAFGYLSGDKDVYDFLKNTQALVRFLATMMGLPPVISFLERTGLLSKMAPSPNDPEGLGRMMKAAREVVAERLCQPKQDRQDMLASFIRNGIPQQQIEAEILLQILAGAETTATAIRSTLLYIITSPRVLTKLRTELDAAIADGRVSSPITNAEAKQLPYLQAVIREGLRINPPFTGLIPKEVPVGGIEFKGVYLPGGTRISHSTWAIMRDPLFGPDVEVFRPERWLEPDANRSKMDQTVDLCFGYGRWGCLGKPVAYMELNKIYVELLRRFEFDLVNPQKPWSSENYNMWMQSDMIVRIMERETEHAKQK